MDPRSPTKFGKCFKLHVFNIGTLFNGTQVPLGVCIGDQHYAQELLHGKLEGVLPMLEEERCPQ